MIALLSLTLASAAAPAAVSTTTPPRVYINEVQVNPTGPDAGFEWFELAILDPVSPGALDGWSLVDQDGATVFDLPTGASFLGGWSVGVMLGEVRPGMASVDLASRRASMWFRGPTSDELLPDEAGALALKSVDGKIVDFVAWGHSDPPGGSEFTAAVAATEWGSADFVDLSFDAAAPCFPGATIGRDRWSTDTNAAADWSGNGGANALGATLAQKNDARVVDVPGLLERSQALVTSAFASYGAAPTEVGRFSVPDSSLDGVEVTDLPGPGFEVMATHRFVVSDTVANTLEVWTGVLTARTSVCGSRCTRLEITGSVSAPSGDGLTVAWRRDLSGYGGSTLFDVQDTSLILTLAGSDSARATISDQQVELVGEGHVRLSGTRTESNWGQPESFQATFVQDVRDVSASQRLVDSTTTMPHPAFAVPAVGSTVDRESVSITEVVTGTVDFMSPEEYVFTRSIDYFLDSVLVGRVTPMDPAVDVVLRTSGSAGDVLGGFSHTSTTPLRSPSGVPQFDLEVSTTQDTSRIGEKESTWVESRFERVDPDTQVTLLATTSFHVDPPVQTWHKGNAGKSQTLANQSKPTYGASDAMSGMVGPFGIYCACVRTAALLGVGGTLAGGPAGGAIGVESAQAACAAAAIIWTYYQ